MRVFLLGLVVSLSTGFSAFAAETVEILRDNFGTPHIFARTSAGAAFAAGYAQAEDRKDALLRNLRGAGSDDTVLAPKLQAVIKAFCAGINRYLREQGRQQFRRPCNGRGVQPPGVPDHPWIE